MVISLPQNPCPSATLVRLLHPGSTQCLVCCCAICFPSTALLGLNAPSSWQCLEADFPFPLLYFILYIHMQTFSLKMSPKVYFSTFLLLVLYGTVHTEKCYSCSSPMLHARWPKNEETNQLQYLTDFPWFANESCDEVRNLIPVVDCPGSVCIKAIIKEPPAKRDVCVETGAVVRDCWSRVMGKAGAIHALDPKPRNNMVRLVDEFSIEKTIGYIYTCEGFLCNLQTKLEVLTTFVILVLAY